MNHPCWRQLIIAALIFIPAQVQAELFLNESETVQLIGEARLRYESDFDSQTEAGIPRDDRQRMRFRARLGMRYLPTENLLFQVRARTGPEFSQQSTNITIADFSGGDNDDFSAVLEQWFVQLKSGSVQTWIGRNQFPFWTHNNNEMFWSNNATIAGGFASYRIPDTWPDIELRGGYFGLPDGAYDIAGSMGAGQAIMTYDPALMWRIKIGAGLFVMNGADSSRYLLDGNGTRDYQIGIFSWQVDRAVTADLPGIDYVRMGGEFIHNFESYSANDPDPVTAAFENDRTGFVASLYTGRHGKAGNKGRWHAGYKYAYIEKLAINASYAQSDWTRWGRNRQEVNSNIKGHEFEARYWLTNNINLRARLYLVDAITTVEDGNRFRLDMYYNF
jgi:hypothetical protein